MCRRPLAHAQIGTHMDRKLSLSAVAVTTLLLSGVAASASAAGTDADRDGIPNRWERTHGMNPFRAADAGQDFDRDGLANVREYRLGSLLRDEDTDNDGHDDGDEVTDGYRNTDVDDSDTNSNGTRDGDEDSDRDGVDNEDEDDADESCRDDDDDRDGDSVDDEDENELDLRPGVADSDDDGTLDGDEDHDEDGQANEDDDDSDDDACRGDHDGDGESDEDENDVLGTIASYDATTGTLVVTAAGTAGYTATGVVTDETEIDFEDADGDESEHEDVDERQATTADLVAGVVVAELEFEDDRHGDEDESRSVGASEDRVLEEVEIYLPQP
jgi:hypothetical protein